MDQSHTLEIATAVRRDGWTSARRTRFLELLAGHGDVRAACAAIGLSREAAYRLRRRDPLFARAWAAALPHAREASEQALACRAIDGIEEDVWYRGEVVGTRRRYDSRLLLAHLARLDAQAANGTAREDAARFDELVALASGFPPSDVLAADDDGLPESRDECVAVVTEFADDMARDKAEESGIAPEDVAPPTSAERWQAGADVAAQWDAWVAEARATVDRLLAEPLEAAEFSPRTVSTVSSSPLALASGRGQLRA